MEDYAWVIEYMPLGHSEALRREAAVQLLGVRYFTLLEATIDPASNIVLGQKVCVGKEGRKEVTHIKGRLNYSDLTNGAREFLPDLRSLVDSLIKVVAQCHQRPHHLVAHADPALLLQARGGNHVGHQARYPLAVGMA